jgi:Nif-specific regulatory protein
MGDESGLSRLEVEHELFRRLLDLGLQEELEPFLKKALALLVEAVRARQGYLELYEDDPGDAPRWWIAHGFSEEEVVHVRELVSQGIIGAAIAEGRTVKTASARVDPRFLARPSVQRGQIDAVLCAPIGADLPRGVLYLQGREAPEPFSVDDQERVEMCARHFAPVVDRLVNQQQYRTSSDPTVESRRRLRAESVIGRSPALARLLKDVALVAPLDVCVLLTGASGTGKTQIARVIHESGPRAEMLFVELNCAALPETLLESELFGAMPGAHSTATRRMEGKVSAAEGGSLFLDEVSELSPTAQTKLLQLLQSKEYYPLGSAQVRRADVRIIAATNTELERRVAEGQFREDLFFRLRVMPLRVPTLRERPEDIPELVAAFLSQACERHGLPDLSLSCNALRALRCAEWPGNVRQLAHVVEVAAIRAAGEAASSVEHAHVFADAGAGLPPKENLTFQEATRHFQADLLRQSLEDTSWNVVETSRRLDLSRSHLYTLLRAFGIERRPK